MALGLVSSAACDSWSPSLASSSDRARALLELIEECERTAGRDTRRLQDCIPDPSPGLTPLVLSLMDHRRFFGFGGESLTPGVDAFLEELASEAEDPVLRAAARYYVAAGLMRSVNAAWTEPEDRDARPPDVLGAALRRAHVAQRAARRAEARRRALDAATGSFVGRATSTTETAAARQAALDAATGLSAGVEEEEFRGYGTGGPRVRTFAEAEADLIRRIRHGTVGGTLPELTGTRLDGAEESLSAYNGRVVLLDFWATWCSPCVGALPDLRELVAELPADRFVLLAISVDENRETVTRFMEDEPMPWTNWHTGRRNDIVHTLDVRGFPTYVLVDEHGRILARDRGLTDRLTSLIRATVES